MTSTPKRIEIIEMITGAVKAGARRSKACEIVGIAPSTLRRWQPTDTASVLGDRRTQPRPAPAHKLSQKEQDAIVNVRNQPDYSHLPPSQIVPRLADLGQYIARRPTETPLEVQANRPTETPLEVQANQMLARPTIKSTSV